MDFTFDYSTFIIAFPAFSNPTDFPEATLQGYWNVAICYISDNNYGYLNGNSRNLAINLMTAHLAGLSVIIASGESAGYVQSATIDKISVSLTPPPVPNQFQWWLNQTPYGSQLLALLQIKSVGGWYTGGIPAIGAFRI